MSRKVNITCRYYWVKSYTEEGTSEDKYDLLEWFDKISDMTLTELTQQVGQVKGRLDEITQRGAFYALNFVRMESYSSTYIVTEEEKAKHVDIYINSFFESPVCFLDPIKTKKDFMGPEKKYGKIKLTISSVNDYVPTHGCAYEDALNRAREMDAMTMSFEFGTGRKKGVHLDADVVRTIISDAFNNMGVVSVARVKMEDEEGTAVYNLLENVKNTVISLKADSKGEIEYKVIADAMVNAYK